MNVTQLRHNGGARLAMAVGTAALAALLLAGCTARPAAQPAATAGSQPAKTVETAPIEKVQIAGAVRQTADVQASAQVGVTAKIGGDVVKVLKQRGDVVQAGDVLAQLDTKDLALQQQKAEIAVKSAADALANGKINLANQQTKLEQALVQATQTYNQMRNQYDLGKATQSQLDQAANAYTNAKRDLDALKAQSVTAQELQLENAKLSLAQADEQLADAQIKAPIGGVLTQLPIQLGMTIGTGFQAAQIEQLNPAKIVALLTPDNYALVEGKKQLNVEVPGSGKPIAGTVSYLADVMDTKSGTYELDLSASNADRLLKPGMKVQVVLSDDSAERVVAVPSLSIVREGSGNYVFVLNGNHVEKRQVTLGRVNGLNQEILSGVKAGEILVTSGQNALKDGDQVKVVDPTGSASAGASAGSGSAAG